MACNTRLSYLWELGDKVVWSMACSTWLLSWGKDMSCQQVGMDMLLSTLHLLHAALSAKSAHLEWDSLVACEGNMFGTRRALVRLVMVFKVIGQGQVYTI